VFGDSPESLCLVPHTRPVTALAQSLRRRPAASVTGVLVVITAVGVVGTALIARASYVVGTLPGNHLDRAAATGPWRWLYEAGVVLVILAWLSLGRLVFRSSATGMCRRISWAAAATALPLLLAAPVTSQDVWAYLGQANVAAHGLNPYSAGPGAVPGPFADAVAREWLDAGSPYGPLWLWICRLVVQVTQHPWAGMFLLRGLSIAGVAGIGLALVRLCRVTGGRPEIALWLAVAGPFTLLMMVGAVHNESVMLALLLGGVTVAATDARMWRALVLGAVLVGAAAAIKVTALVALPFLPLVWLRYADPARAAADASDPTYRRWIRTGAPVVAIGVATVLFLGAVTGLGIGWIHTVGDGAVGGHWFSVPQQLGNLLHLVDPRHVASSSAGRYSVVHPIGLAFLALSLAAVTITALRRPPLQTLALAFLLVVVSSTAPRVWYLLWPLVFVAVVVAAERAPRGLLAGVAAGSATLAVWFPPSVRPPLPEWLLLALFVPLAVAFSPVLSTRDTDRSEPRVPGHHT
jgi:alpha-1,6-mannosyltransferase